MKNGIQPISDNDKWCMGVAQGQCPRMRELLLGCYTDLKCYKCSLCKKVFSAWQFLHSTWHFESSALIRCFDHAGSIPRPKVVRSFSDLITWSISSWQECSALKSQILHPFSIFHLAKSRRLCCLICFVLSKQHDLQSACSPKRLPPLFEKASFGFVTLQLRHFLISSLIKGFQCMTVSAQHLA